MKKTKVVVTGAGGYIGSIATYLLLQKGYSVVAIDNFQTGYHEPLEYFQEKFGKDMIVYYDRDIKKSCDDVFEKEKNISAVLHYAASCLVNESMENPEKYFSNNVCGSQNLLSTILRHKITNIVFSSTCETYGEVEYVPIDENHPSNSKTPYGISKRMVEQMIETYGKRVGLKYMILRYFNVCGASDDGEIGDSKRPSVLLMQNAVRGALGIEPFYLTCAKMDTPDGTPIRDYINVVDLNEAHILALEHLLKGGCSDIINLGTGTGNSVLEVVTKVQEITHTTFDIKEAEARKGEPTKLVADTKKAKQILGWESKRSIEDSVKSLVSWYTKHPNGWAK